MLLLGLTSILPQIKKESFFSWFPHLPLQPHALRSYPSLSDRSTTKKELPLFVFSFSFLVFLSLFFLWLLALDLYSLASKSISSSWPGW